MTPGPAPLSIIRRSLFLFALLLCPHLSAALEPNPVSAIRVEIAGTVNRPGSYVLPADARLSDLISAAGSFLDGERVRIGTLRGGRARQADFATVLTSLRAAFPTSVGEEPFASIANTFDPSLGISIRPDLPRLLKATNDDVHLLDGDVVTIGASPATGPDGVSRIGWTRNGAFDNASSSFIVHRDRSVERLSHGAVEWDPLTGEWGIPALILRRPSQETGDVVVHFPPRPVPSVFFPDDASYLLFLEDRLHVAVDGGKIGGGTTVLKQKVELHTSVANGGFTGLFDVPNARLLPEDRFRFGASYYEPYRTTFATVGLLPFLEVTGRINAVTSVNVDSPGWDGYGSYKDKEIDLKLRLHGGTKYLPAFAFVWNDLHGTRLFEGRAVVASKRIRPFDLTVGFGDGRFGNRLFGGVEAAIGEKVTAVAEFSPVAYGRMSEDPANRSFGGSSPSRINFGLRWRPFDFVEFTGGYQRGNTFTFSAALDFAIGKPLVPVHDIPSSGDRDRASREIDPVAREAARLGFTEVVVERHEVDGSVRVAGRNGRYRDERTAVRNLAAESVRADDTARSAVVTLTENGVPWAEGRIDKAPHVAGAEGKGKVAVAPPSSREAGRPSGFRFGFVPRLDTYLNDPSGFMKYRLGAEGRGEYGPWAGGRLAGAIQSFPLNTISSNLEPLSIPVRSDAPSFLDETIVPARLLGQQTIRFDDHFVGRATAGFLEPQYAGVDAETVATFANGRILLGLSGNVVRKRVPGWTLDTTTAEPWRSSLLASTGWYIPSTRFFVEATGGRFLAGDPGVRFSLTKDVGGVLLTGWYSITDTSAFTDPENRGYRDKGISVVVPLSLLVGRETRSAGVMKVAAWTRDTGQEIDREERLFLVPCRFVPASVDTR